MHALLPRPRAILFDLDGTLADTAPDLAQALNKLRTDRGLDPAPYENLRPYASAGARGLIGAGFGLQPGADEYEELRIEFLDNYAAAISVHSRLFTGVPELLAYLRQTSVAWGIVTNKAMRFTHPLVPLLGLADADCVIGGDTTPHPKPHPAPLLEAARRLTLAPQDCWYVGDDLRDIQAGKAAGMTTIAAGWGYCGDEGPTNWNADAVAVAPMDLMDLFSLTSS
ncbi:HAD family hydrolase [Noviherbaspirillum pedocola]|uniref:HAD-IA family hydrolase n=1 Tax=Noviherbaspirillum pedocola TaxID=2801341 RepID=A0A934W8X3_9BURK|nr:HAD-IA family hydrolase [Noviherbaspirillum pedocola]MBK4738085.1 HAD-IA family hydrolase [Noviherbaspirillum pedocola]